MFWFSNCIQYSLKFSNLKCYAAPKSWTLITKTSVPSIDHVDWWSEHCILSCISILYEKNSEHKISVLIHLEIITLSMKLKPVCLH